MSEEEKFDAIIIGAGPAGSACAYLLAKAGKNVLIIDRGASVGGKNLTGGRLYTYALELVEPCLHKEAPLQRKVVSEQIMMLGEKSGITVDYTDYSFSEELPQSYTVLRAPFDEWFAGKAEEAGAILAAGIRVDELLVENGKVVGVQAGEDQMFADIVVGADGINSFMAQKSGLRDDLTPHEVGVGVKELIELPAEVIQQRFHLAPDEGAARVFLGGTEGIVGGGFLYTNKDSISLGLVFNPEGAAHHGKKIQEILQDFKMHPAVYPLIEGGATIEYGAHLVSELGWNGVPKKLFRDGFLIVGDAAGFCMSTGIILRGIDLAIVSGVAAARAILGAGDSAAIGRLYMNELEKLKLIQTMQQVSGFPEILSMPRMAGTYPQMVNEVMNFMFKVDGNLPDKIPKGIRRIVKQHVSIGELLADAWKGVRNI